MTNPGYTCSCCGAFHAELPFDYSTMAPDAWDSSFEDRPDSMLSSDQCIIKAEHFFVKGKIEIDGAPPHGVADQGRVVRGRMLGAYDR